MNILKLGLPKGSLEKPTLELFAKAGWQIKPASRNYFPEVDDPELSCSICRPQEMSRYVESGLLDCGITGKDWILENQSDVEVIADLVYSKVSRKPTRWIIAVPGDSDIKTLEDLEGKKISTELVGYSTRFSRSAESMLTLNSPGAPPRPRSFPALPTPLLRSLKRSPPSRPTVCASSMR